MYNNVMPILNAFVMSVICIRIDQRESQNDFLTPLPPPLDSYRILRKRKKIPLGSYDLRGHCIVELTISSGVHRNLGLTFWSKNEEIYQFVSDNIIMRILYRLTSLKYYLKPYEHKVLERLLNTWLIC